MLGLGRCKRFCDFGWIDRTRRDQASLVLSATWSSAVTSKRPAHSANLRFGMPTNVLDQIVRQTNSKSREAVEATLAGEAEAAFKTLDQAGGQVIEQPDGKNPLPSWRATSPRPSATKP